MANARLTEVFLSFFFFPTRDYLNGQDLPVDHRFPVRVGPYRDGLLGIVGQLARCLVALETGLKMDRICYARMIGRKITTGISFVGEDIFWGRKT